MSAPGLHRPAVPMAARSDSRARDSTLRGLRTPRRPPDRRHSVHLVRVAGAMGAGAHREEILRRPADGWRPVAPTPVGLRQAQHVPEERTDLLGVWGEHDRMHASDHAAILAVVQPAIALWQPRFPQVTQSASSGASSGHARTHEAEHTTRGIADGAGYPLRNERPQVAVVVVTDESGHGGRST